MILHFQAIQPHKATPLCYWGPKDHMFHPGAGPENFPANLQMHVGKATHLCGWGGDIM